MDLNISELSALTKAFELLNDHHDASKPEVVVDLDKAQSQLAANNNQLAGLLKLIVTLAPVVAAILAALREAKTELPPTPNPADGHPTTPPVVIPPVVTTPPVVSGPGGPVSGPAVVPDRLVLTLASVSGPHRTGGKTLEYNTDRLPEIVLVGENTSLDDGSILNFDAGLSARGVDLRVDLDPSNTPAGQTNHPELLGKIKYIAEDAATGEVLGSIGGPDASIRSKTDYTDAKVSKGVEFVPNRWAESGGMAVAVKPKRKGGPVLIYAEIDAQETDGFKTPEIR